MTIETVNARIGATTLGPEDHGILTSYIHLTFEGSGQGYGGFGLASASTCAMWVTNILSVANVDDWSKLPGKYVRVRREDGLIVEIGHIVEERWYNHRASIERLGLL